MTLFVLLCGPILFYYSLTTPPLLDENLGLQRVSFCPADFSGNEASWHAIDHPALSNWVDWAVLRALRADVSSVPAIDPNRSYEWNVAHRLAPRYPVMVLRAAGTTALVAAMVCFFFLCRGALGNPVWAFLIVAPLVLPPYLGRYVGGYIWTDPYLAFFTALSGLLLVSFHLSGRPAHWARVICMGVIAGLAVSTKLNGGLILLAYAAYLAAVSRGARRFVLPAAAAAVAFAVFVAVNPVMWHGGPAGWLGVMGEMLRMRARVLQMHAHLFGEFAFADRLLFLFPLWYLLPVFAFFVVKARREKWFLPAALWAGFLIIGTVATTAEPFNRYRMPLDFGLAILVGLSVCQALERLWRREISFKQFLAVGEARQ